MKGRCLPLGLGKHMYRRRSHHNRRLQRGYGVEKVSLLQLLRYNMLPSFIANQRGRIIRVCGATIESFLVEVGFFSDIGDY